MKLDEKKEYIPFWVCGLRKTRGKVNAAVCETRVLN